MRPVREVFRLLLDSPALVALINPEGLGDSFPRWAALVLHGVSDESFQGKSLLLSISVGLEA